MSKQTQFLHPSTGVDVPVHRESLSENGSNCDPPKTPSPIWIENGL